jgi:hypothetical protein
VSDIPQTKTAAPKSRRLDVNRAVESVRSILPPAPGQSETCEAEAEQGQRSRLRNSDAQSGCADIVVGNGYREIKREGRGRTDGTEQRTNIGNDHRIVDKIESRQCRVI